MARRPRRRKKLSRFTIIAVLVLCFVVCGTMTYRTISLKAQAKEYTAQITELQEQKAKLKAEKKQINDFKSYVKTNDYMEELAREKLGLVYPNEIIFEPDNK